ncbi:hypothetical protein ACL9RL_03875 [Plantibacter sp. Mn2098]|uniref:hypothetical protein n=1 Tax=Plantibacter sp. Mn2098 TaxID=3395266 RepID=UPI003BD4ED5B
MNFQNPPLSAEQLLYIAEGAEWQELDSVWLYFKQPFGYSYLPHKLESFSERREGFLWALTHFLEHGQMRLLWWSDASLVTGTPDEQVDIIRQAFPTNDDGMDDGRWFFSLESQVGVIWEWPGRDPKPFVD